MHCQKKRHSPLSLCLPPSLQSDSINQQRNSSRLVIFRMTTTVTTTTTTATTIKLSRSQTKIGRTPGSQPALLTGSSLAPAKKCAGAIAQQERDSDEHHSELCRPDPDLTRDRESSFFCVVVLVSVYCTGRINGHRQTSASDAIYTLRTASN